MNRLQDKKLIVLVERHLALESQMAATLDELNHAMNEVLSQAGIRGPTREDLHKLAPLREKLHQSAGQVAQARRVLLGRINLDSAADISSIREFLRLLPTSDRLRLEKLRLDALGRSSQAQANLVRNQASLYYTYDFHRKYLAGVLHGDLEGQNYGADGQPNDVKSGNILGKTC